MDYSLIEMICWQSNLSNLPALRQMKVALKNNRAQDAERIAKNIISFLKTNGFIPKKNTLVEL